MPGPLRPSSLSPRLARVFPAGPGTPESGRELKMNLSVRHRGTIFRDKRVFLEDWVPSDLECRDAELSQLALALEPVIDAEPAADVFATGPSGVGKTMSTRYILEKLNEHRLDLETAYVNCWSDSTQYRALYRIIDELRGTTVHQYATSVSRLREPLDDLDQPLVAILDEVDQLTDTQLLYDLYEASGVNLVLVANEQPAVLADLDDRLQSRLRGATSIRFDRYALDELLPILQQRVRHGLQDGVIDKPHLERIARAADGSARDAISILRTAAQQALTRENETITTAIVDVAIEDVGSRMRPAVVDRLNPHQEVLLEVLLDHDRLSPGELYDRYTDRIDDPRSNRTVRKYLRKLERYDLLVSSGTSQTRQYAPKEPGAELIGSPS